MRVYNFNSNLSTSHVAQWVKVSCCGTGSIPGLGNSTCFGHGQKTNRPLNSSPLRGTCHLASLHSTAWKVLMPWHFWPFPQAGKLGFIGQRRKEMRVLTAGSLTSMNWRVRERYGQGINSIHCSWSCLSLTIYTSSCISVLPEVLPTVVRIFPHNCLSWPPLRGAVVHMWSLFSSHDILSQLHYESDLALIVLWQLVVGTLCEVIGVTSRRTIDSTS